jgi:hypothetical protein
LKLSAILINRLEVRNGRKNLDGCPERAKILHILTAALSPDKEETRLVAKSIVKSNHVFLCKCASSIVIERRTNSLGAPDDGQTMASAIGPEDMAEDKIHALQVRRMEVAPS